MLAICRQSLMKYLASVSLAAGCGVADPGGSLVQIPAELFTELTDETPEPEWHSVDRTAGVPRSEDPLSPDAQALLRTLAADSAWPVREAAAQALARCLRQSPVLARLRAVCEWALADPPAERLAVARALNRSIRVPGADIALAHLARQGEPFVRRAALAAMGTQLSPEDPIVSDVAGAALADPERRVRRAARKLLIRAMRPARTASPV